MNEQVDYRSVIDRLVESGQLGDAAPATPAAPVAPVTPAVPIAPAAPMVPSAPPSGRTVDDYQAAIQQLPPETFEAAPSGEPAVRPSGVDLRLTRDALAGQGDLRLGPTVERAQLLGTTRMGPTPENARIASSAAAAQRMLGDVRPDVIADIRRISRDMGIPVPLAAQTYLDRAQQERRRSYERLLQENPGLRAMAQRGSGYADFLEDARELATAETAFNALRSFGEAFPTVAAALVRAPENIEGIVERRVRGLLGDLADDPIIGSLVERAAEATVAGALIPAVPGVLGGDRGRGIEPVTERLEQVSEFIGPAPEDRNIVTDAAGALGQLAAQALAVALTGLAGGVGVSGALTLDEQVQRVAAAGAEGTLEGDIGIVGATLVSLLLDRVNLGAIFEGIPESVRNRVVRALASGASEGATEAAQAISSNLIARGVYDPDAGVFDGAAYEGFLGGFAGAVIGALTPGRPRAGGRGEEDEPPLPEDLERLLSEDGLPTAQQRAEEAAASLETTRAAIEETRTFARDPDAVRELLQEAGDQEVTLPAAEVDRLYQEGTLTDADIEYLQVEEELTQQGELSGDVSVAASRLLTLEGDSFSALVDNVRVRPDALTVAEARDAIANREADIERLQATLQQAQAEVTEVADLARRVADDLAQAAPQYTAGQRGAMGRLLAERYAARATLFGPEVTAQALYADDRVTFQRQAAPGAQALEQRAASVGMRTSEFERWFGNSRVVDETGQPLVVYHTTPADFDAFQGSAYFGLTPEVAEGEGRAGTPQWMTDLTGVTEMAPEGTRTIPVFLSLQNPASLEDVARVSPDAATIRAAIPALEAAGFDGVWNPSAGEAIAFSPNQIKSIFNPAPTDAPGILEQGPRESADTGVETGVPLATRLSAAFQLAQSRRFRTGRELKLELQEASRAAQAQAGVDLTTLDEANIDRLADFVFEDALEALTDNANAIGWYDRTVTAALEEVASLHPEILSDSARRLQFTWALAVTSNGLKVNKNFELAIDAYEALLASEDQRFPARIGIGTAATQIDGGLAMYGQMLDRFNGDHEVLAEFMNAQVPVRDLEREFGVSISGEGKGELVRGASILGPKIGNGFFANLYGNFDALTMDRWLMRTVGRWRGTLVFINEPMVTQKQGEIRSLFSSLQPAERRAISALLEGSGITVKARMSNEAINDLAIEVAKRSAAPAWRTEINALPGGETMRKLGNALAKYLDGQVEAPAGARERAFLREVFQRGLNRLQQAPEVRQISNQELTMSDLQALLWYPEKRLYDTAKQTEGESRGYEDDEAPDYANAAREVVRNRLGQTGRAGRAGRRAADDGRGVGTAAEADQPLTLEQPAAPIAGQAGSATTQVATTKGSYQKAVALAESVRPGLTSVLDYGAGLGLGADAMRAETDARVDSYEPFPERWRGEQPVTYTDSTEITQTYDAVVNLNVLNVLEPALRDQVARDIISKIAPGGVAIIGTRKFKGDVDQARNAEPGGEPGSVWITRGGQRVYQKGFDGNELVTYLQSLAPEGYTVERGRGVAANTAIIRAPEALTLEQPAEGPQTPERGQVGAPRGAYILPKRDGDANVFQFTTSADPSTFVHEVGHMFLYQMVRDLSDARLSETGRAQLEQQIRATRSWFRSSSEQAYTDLGKLAKDARRRASRLAAGPEKEQANLRALRLEAAYDRARQGGGAAYMQQVASAFLDPSAQGYDEAAEVVFHELWARGFEKYLGSGSAPSAALRTVFARFAKYIANVYRSLRQLNVEISPEVADVFDRLLATDAAIAEVRRGSVYRLSPGVLDGATPNEAQELRRLAAEAETEAMTQIARREQNALNQKARAQRRARREQLTADITEQVGNEPVYRAMELAATGSTPNGDIVLNTGKIRRREVIDAVGVEFADALPRRVVALEPKDAIDLSQLALLSGFSDIDTMLVEMTAPDLRRMQDEVRARVDEQLQAEFGAETDPANLSDEAIEAAQNTRFQELQRLQLRILRRLAAEPLARVARRQAEQVGAPAAAADQAAEAAARAEEAAAASRREAVQANLARIRAQVQRQANVPQRRAQAAAGRQTRAIQRNVDPAVIQEAARRYVQSIEVRQATPARYQQTANRMSLKIERAIAARDYAQAADLMEQRALNLAIAREAADVQAMVTKQRRRWRDLTGRADRRLAQSYDVDWVNAIRLVLEPLGFGRRVDTNYSAEQALAAMQAVEPTLAVEIRNQINGAVNTANAAAQEDPKQPHRALTVERLTEILDLADQLLANARNTHGMLLEGRRVSFDRISTEAQERVDMRRDVARREARQGPRASAEQEKWVKKRLGFGAWNRRVADLARDLDNGDPRGPFTLYVVRPIQFAESAFFAARREPIKRLAELLNGRRDLMRDQRISADELAPGFEFRNKGELIMAIAQTGSESGMRKLLTGGGGTGRQWSAWTSTQNNTDALDTSRWDAFFNRAITDGTITKADMDLVQGVFDIFKSTLPGAQAAHKKMFGYRFTELDARPIVTPFGIYEGGYVPAVQDRFANPSSDKFDDAEAMSQQANASMFPGPERGFTVARTDATYVLDLDIGRLPAHFDRVMKFTHLGPVVQQVGRLINHRPFRAQLDRVNSEYISTTFIPWLQRVARQQVATPSADSGGRRFDDALTALQRRVGSFTMAGNVVNAAEQMFGLFPALTRLSVKDLLAASATWKHDDVSARRHMLEVSPLMRERLQLGVDVEMREVNAALTSPSVLRSTQEFMLRYSYILQQGVANIMEPTIWLAAEREAMRKVYPQAYSDALAATGDDAQANATALKEVYAYADNVVESTQGSTRPGAISSVEGGTPGRRLLTQFLSFFNAMGNNFTAEKNIALNSEMGWFGRMGRVGFVYLAILYAPAVASELLRLSLSGELDELDEMDDEELWSLGRQVFVDAPVKFALATVPLVGPFAAAAYGRTTSDPYDDQVRGAAAVSVAGQVGIDGAVSLANLILYAYRGATGGDNTEAEVAKDLRQLLSAIGLSLGLPNNWLARPARYAERVREGEADPEGMVDIIQGILTGRDGTED